MAEPEGLLIEGARVATAAARDLWFRVAPPGAPPALPLARVRARLELFLEALLGQAPPILPADRPPAPTWLARVMGRAPRHLTPRVALAATDGVRIWLPRVLEAPAGEPAALATYRLLALEQAARVVRGTPRAGRLPPSGTLERDLYLLAEAVALDAELARRYPGLVPDLAAARAAALADRPPPDALRPVERQVEQWVRRVLVTAPRAPVPEVPLAPTPAHARAWARGMAGRLAGAGGRYRGSAPVGLWGVPAPDAAGPAPEPAAGTDPADAVPPGRVRSATLRHRPRVRQPGEDEDDPQPGTWMVRLDDPMEHVEDPMGLQRPADRDDSADAAELADSLSELPEARMVRTPGRPREVLESDAGVVVRPTAPPAGTPAAAAGITYPEWDYRLRAYRPHGAVVRPTVAPGGSAEWVDDVMARHAALVRQVRRRFDGLRSRRVRLDRQVDGPEVDVSAYVAAFADWRAGRSAEDRFYVAARPGRRELAITLLIDVSASTDSWVSGRLRIVDVEKEALVVLLEALDALGDRHAVLGFSGQGAGEVRLLTVKAFAEPVDAAVRRRIAALEPDRYTRAGAAIRHASALLAAQDARYRLLLILSDGKPNDVDEYEGRYGVEDTRQAVAEARLQGLIPFCLTVDRDAPAYLPAIFGRGGYALLRRPELLPTVLVDVVRRLLCG
jgi:nitric oxide reductase NorD protein